MTEQEKKYGYRLAPQGNFYRRHLMVQHFLASQLHEKKGQRGKKGEIKEKDRKRRDLAYSIANNFDRGQTTGRNLIRWEQSWVANREIPERDNAERDSSWMDDEELKMSVRNFAKKQGQRMYYQWFSFICIRIIFLIFIRTQFL